MNFLFNLFRSEESGSQQQDFSWDKECPLAKQKFSALRDEQLACTPPLPYIVAELHDADNRLFLDGAHALRWLRQEFSNPQTKKSATKVHLLILRKKEANLEPLESCENKLSSDFAEAASAFSLDNSDAAEIARKRFIFRKFPLLDFDQDIVTLCNYILHKNRHDIFALTHLGMVWQRDGETRLQNFAQAHVYFERALRENPAKGWVMTRIGEFYGLRIHKNQDFQVIASACFRKALKHNLADAESFAVLGDLIDAHSIAVLGDLLRVGFADIPQNMQKAEEYLAASLQLDPNDPKALTSYGELLRTTSMGQPKRLERAMRSFQRAIFFNSENSAALTGLAELHRRGVEGILSQDLQQAEHFFKKALEADPNNPFALTSYAHFLYSNNKKTSEYPKAKVFLERALQSDPENKYALLLLGMLLKKGGSKVAQDETLSVWYISRAYFIDKLFVKRICQQEGIELPSFIEGEEEKKHDASK
jgi:tetratricopeptide (TPR) repeat protein